MAKKAFQKHLKKSVSLLALSAILTGGLISNLPAREVIAVEKETTSTKRNVMYYGDWSIWGGQGNFYPKDIPAEHLTHLNFAFLDFDSNGNLKFTDKDAAVGAPVGEEGVQWGGPNAGIISAFQELRAKNPNMKLGISVGGWSKSGDFSEVTADPIKRAKLVDNLVKYVEYANMDFVDLDWEYPGDVRQPDKVDNIQDEGTTKATPADKENYIIFLEELRVDLDKKGAELGKTYEISVALPAPKAKVDLGIDVDRLFDVVDFANIMTYDMRGAWDPYSGHQTGLYTNPLDPTAGAGLSVDESVQYFIDQGAEPEKIVVGAAYYTRGWDQVSEGPDSSLPGLFGDAALTNKDADQTPSRGAVNEAPMKVGEGGRASGVWSYKALDDLKTKFPGLKEYWDDTAKAPYLYDAESGKFFTYDDKRSIAEKTDYVNANDLGGMIGWMASQDKESTGTNVRDELTIATKEGLFGNAELPDHEIVYADLDIECSIKPLPNPNGGAGGGYEVIIKNNEKLEESDSVLKELERSGETIKTPILYIDSDLTLTAGDHMAGNVTTENGQTIVDIKGVWEGKNIEPGQSYKFFLNASGETPTDTSDITSVSIGQRMNEKGTVLSKQVIFGDETVGPEVNQAPTLSGISNKTITIGDNFNPLASVKANDKEDGDLTSKVKVSGTVDTDKAGKYTLTYSVTDSKGLETTKTRVITVKDKDITPPPVENNKPILHGIKDLEINVSDSFDPLKGITATDKEDGTLTSKIKVSGTVDTDKSGEYTLTYSVTDSANATTTQKRVVTVKDVETGTDDFDINKVYNTGDIVTYKGNQYKTKWWTQGAYPDKSDAFELIVDANPDGSTPHVPGRAYNGGDKVSYDGTIYQANWWTNTIPGSDSSWTKL